MPATLDLLLDIFGLPTRVKTMAPSRGADVTQRPSLDRLKALDSLGDFDAQVAEARLLCTHNARTEMVLKWLLSKMSKETSIPEDPHFWKALAFTLRALPRERAAAILRPSTIFEAAQQALGASQNDHGLLLGVASFLKLLIDLRAGESGMHLRPILSMPASLAADFVAACHRCAANIHMSGDGISRTQDITGMLLAFSDGVWKARRLAPDEDEVFAQKCLVPTVLLLNISQSDGNSANKRNRQGDTIQEPTLSHHHAKVLLCKHVFLPARKALFASQSPIAWSKKQAENDRSSIAERFAPVKAALHGGEIDAVLLPALLNVGLSFPTFSSPRQRSQERTWTEALFDALVDCSVMDENLTHPAVLMSMLKVVGQRSSLSKEALHKLVLAYGLPSLNSRRTANLDIVAEIIALDATALARRDRAETLFNAVSAAEPALSDKDGSTRTLLCERIIVPTMRAFARNRDLKAFIELWKDQLSLGEDHSSVWHQLTSPFAEMVEEHLSVDDLLSLLRDCREANSSLPLSEIVVPCAALHGIRNAGTVDALHEEIGLLVSTFFSRSEFTLAAVGTLHMQHLWTLLTCALQLWAPLWLKRAADTAELFDQAKTMLSAPIVKEAERKFVECQDQGDESVLLQTVSSFLMTLTTFLRPLCNEAEQLCRRQFEQARTDAQRRFLVTSLLSQSASAPAATRLLRSELVLPLGKGVHQESGPEGTATALAFVALMECWSSGGALTDSHSAMTGSAAPQHTAGSVSCEQVMLTLQSVPAFPLTALSTSERERQVNDFVHMLIQSPGPGEKLPLCLAALVALLREQCPGATIVSDPRVLLQISEETAPFLELEPSRLCDRTFTLLQELAVNVCKQILDSSKAPGNKEVLENFAANLNTFMKALRKNKGNNAVPISLAVVTAVVSTLNGSLPTEKRRALLNPKTINDLAGELSTRLGDGLEAEMRRDDARMTTMADSLLHLPLEDLDVKRRKKIEHLISQILGDSLDVSAQESSSSLLSLAIALKRKLHDDADADPGPLVQHILTLLQERRYAPDHDYLIDFLGQACEDANSAFRRTVLQALISDDNAVPTTSGMALLQALLPSLKKEDFTTELGGRPDIAPSATLRCLLNSLQMSSSPVICHSICESIFVLLRTKSFMANQSTIEMTISTLKDLSDRFFTSIASRIIFRDTCRIFGALLQQHRARLRDRLHLVVELMQTLIGAFFVNPSTKIASKRPMAQHAQVLARLLQLLCNPPRLHGKHSDLVDEARKAQAHVGRYVQHVLHHYCSQVLVAAPREGVREALMPGLWAMIEAMEVNDPDAVKILSAAMNNSERALLRGVYEEYKMFGKWKGG